ncbi:MAG: sigma-70 family RNA polymerase sigma factor [Planctomyces sp.]|nr:sigma-70 family RNA polymerase sigma factor [Planctomyces sp.]
MVQNDDVGRGMTVTSTSLIFRIQSKDQGAWSRFVRLYTPFVYAHCRKFGLQPSDAEDVCQNVMRSVFVSVDQYRRTGSFRSWVAHVTRNKVIDFLRKAGNHPGAAGGTDFQIFLASIPAESTDASQTRIGNESQSSVAEDPLLLKALMMIQEEYEPTTWTAFWRMVVENHSAADIAVDLGWTQKDDPDSLLKGTRRVRQAKLRVLKRLKEEFGDVLDLPK